MSWKKHANALEKLLNSHRAPGSSARRQSRRAQARLGLELLERRDLLATFNLPGDFNGDGVQDLLKLVVPGDTVSNGSLQLALWDGTTAVTSPAATVVPNLGAWQEFLVADVNGDARADVIGRVQASGVWRAAVSTGTSFVVQNWLGTWSPGTTWADVRVGDFNGDGRQDVAGRNLATGSWQVAVSTGTQFVTSDWGGNWSAGVSHATTVTGDFDGDGRADVAGRDPSGNWRVARSTGTGFITQTWGQWDPLVAWGDVLVGDFSGDGKADVVGRHPTSNQLQVAQSTGTGFTTSVWGTAQAGRVAVQAVDLNEDGRADLVGRATASGPWSAVSLSTGSGFVSQTWEKTNATPYFQTLTWQGSTIADFGGPTRAMLTAFNQVRNTVEMEFYPGFKKGSQATVETRGGNDWEQAAAVVYLLPVSVVEARYVRGTIQVPIADAMRWTGATQAWAAVNVLYDLANSDPTVQTDTGGSPVSVQFGHTWLEARLPGPSGLQWVPMDPSWKFRDVQPGVSGIRTAVPFDEEDFFSQVQTETAAEYYADQVAEYLRSQYAAGNLQEQVSLADVPRRGPILPEYLDKPPAQLPYQVVSSSLPSIADLAVQTYRIGISLHNFDGTVTYWSHDFVLPEMSKKRVTVGYVIQNVVPNVVDGVDHDVYYGAAQLLLDGQVLATGNTIHLYTVAYKVTGPEIVDYNDVQYTIEEHRPGNGDLQPPDDTITTSRLAGEWVAIMIGAGQVSDEAVLRQQREVNQAAVNYTNNLAYDYDDAVGAALALAGMRFWQQYDANLGLIAGLHHAHTLQNYVGYGFVTGWSTFQFMGDQQVPFFPEYAGFDIHKTYGTAFDLDGSSSDPNELYLPATNRLRSIEGSNLENAILEEVFNAPSISTTKGIQFAHQNNIQVVTISNRAGYNQLVSITNATAHPLAANVLADIEALVTYIPDDHVPQDTLLDHGSFVTVPVETITLNHWTGAVYFEGIDDDNSNLAAYISRTGPTSGGDTTDEPVAPPPVPIGPLPNETTAGDPANVANGNMTRTETDVYIPNIGVPLAFERHYNTQFYGDVGLGLGWTHSYSDYLYFPGAGKVLWVTSEGMAHTFTPNGQGGFNAPAGVFETLSVLSGGVYLVRSKDGFERRFNSAGKLLNVRDRYLTNVLVMDTSGRLIGVHDWQNPSRYLTFSYGANNRISAVTDFTGRVWSYSYTPLTDPGTTNVRYYLTQVASPSNAATPARVVSYGYYIGGFLHGLMGQIVEPDGGQHSYTYYPNRKVFEVTDPLGNSTSLSYDLYRNRTRFTDERGNETAYDYDDGGLLLRLTHPDHAAESFAWQDGLMQSWTDEFGVAETYLFDGRGNVTSTTDRLGNTTTMTYDPNYSRLSSVTRPDPDGAGPLPAQVTTFTVDASGNVTEILDAMGNRTTMTYDSRGQVLTVTRPKGVATPAVGDYTTTYTYNGAGQVNGITTDLPSSQAFTFDLRGNVLTATDPAGIVTTFTYDLLGRVLTQSLPDPDGAGPLGTLVTAWAYNPMGLVTARTDPRGLTTRYSYDLKQRLAWAESPDRTIAYYGYDAAGNLVSATDELGRTTLYVYDERNRQVQVAYADGAVGRTRYDGKGRVTAATDPLGNATTFTYDELGRLLTATDALGNTVTNTYHPVLGTLTSVEDQRGAVTTFTYDLLDRVTQVRGPENVIVTTDYDANGNVTDVVRYDVTDLAPGAIPPDLQGLLNLPEWRRRHQRTHYDVLDRPDQFTDPSDHTSSVQYDAAGKVLQATDELGRATAYHYDNAGRLDRVTAPDPDGTGPLAAPVTQLTLDANGNVLTTLDPLSHATDFAYDVFDRAVSVTNALGGVGQMLYDVAGQLVGSVDELKRSTLSAHDARGRVVRTTEADPDGAGPLLAPVTRYAYDAVGNLTSVTDALGRVSQYQYDALNRLSQETLPDPDGAGPLLAPETEYGYDDAGNLTSVTDPLDRVTQYAYDLAGRQVSQTRPDPDGAGPQLAPLTQYAYDTLGNLVRVTDPLSRVTTYAYDLLDRLVSETLPDPDGAGPLLAPVTQYGYDHVGNLTSVTDALGRETQFAYDDLDRQTQVTEPDPDGAGPLAAPLTRYAYDAAGNLTGVTDPLTRVTQYQYDALNRRTRETQPDPDGAGPLAASVTQYGYDAVSNLTGVTDGLSHVTQYQYDALNRRTQVTQPDPDGAGPLPAATTAYGYDAAGNLTSVTDPTSNRTDYAYDGLDRPVSETIYLPAQGGGTAPASRTRTYDAAGNVLTQTDRNGRVRRFTYDDLDRQTREEWLDAGNAVVQTITSTYDAADQLLALTDSSSARSYAYDGLGRAVTVTNSTTFGGPTVAFTAAYDAAGNLLSRAETINGAAGATVAYTYDNLDRVTREQQTGGAAAKRVDLAYNSLGQMTQATRYADVAGANLVASTAYGYDQANRLTGITHTKGATTLAAYTLAYDAANRVTSKGSTVDGGGTFGYDDADQLTSASNPAKSYGYDAAGNRTTAGYQTGAYNRVLADGTYTYTYDAEGNRTRRTNAATGATDDYTWDHRNRLTRVLTKTGGGAVTQDVVYAYDALDQRVRKQVDSNGDGTYEAAESYAHSGGQLALAFNGSNQVQERYLYGPGVDQVLAVERAGAAQWFLGDDQGTVRDVLDAGGAVVNHLVVDPFGVVVSQTNPGIPVRFVYTGRERDQETGLYQYRARYYDAAVGRFVSEDPIGFAGGDANLYRYVGNSATNLTDPSGLRPATPLEQQLEGALETLYNGGALTPGTAEHGAYWGEYWGNPEFREYADDLLWNQRVAFLQQYLGDDWFHELARQYLDYQSDSFWSNPLPGTALDGLDFAAGNADVYFVGSSGLSWGQWFQAIGEGVGGLYEGGVNVGKGAVNGVKEAALTGADLARSARQAASVAKASVFGGNVYQFDPSSAMFRGLDQAAKAGEGGAYVYRAMRSGATVGTWDMGEAIYEGDFSRASQIAGGMGAGTLLGLGTGKATGAAASAAGKGLRAVGRSIGSRFPRMQACFTPSTLVSTEGGRRPIGEVEPGDRVYAFDFAAGSWELREVEARHDSTYEGPVVTLDVGGCKVEATAYHPFWVVEGADLEERGCPRHVGRYDDCGQALPGRWVNSHELRAGDVVYSKGGERLRVRRIEQRHERLPVCNLTVRGLHTFAVGEMQTLVHNTSGTGGPTITSLAVTPEDLAANLKGITDPVAKRIALSEYLEALKAQRVAAGKRLDYTVAMTKDGGIVYYGPARGAASPVGAGGTINRNVIVVTREGKVYQMTLEGLSPVNMKMRHPIVDVDLIKGQAVPVAH